MTSPTSPVSRETSQGILLVESPKVTNNPVLLRLRMSGGTIIAGPVAKDAIEGTLPSIPL